MSRPTLIRLVVATLLLGAAACSHPKATVVEEKKPAKPAVKRSSEPSLPEGKRAPSLGLREPDVVSELPDAGSTGPATPVPPGRATEAGTVIVRPPR